MRFPFKEMLTYIIYKGRWRKIRKRITMNDLKKRADQKVLLNLLKKKPKKEQGNEQDYIIH